jgi:hypothetical protein
MKKNIEKYRRCESYIQEHLEYDPEIGGVRWKKRPWRTHVRVGEKAGTDRAGYSALNIMRKNLYVHHVVWFLVYGTWPSNELDHINLDGCDNRIENLRQATRWQNARNVGTQKRRTGRLKGAFTHHEFGNRWHSQIVVDGKQIYLGSFKSEREAHDAYRDAAIKHHKEYARAS